METKNTWHTVALAALAVLERLAPLLLAAAIGVSADALLLDGRAAELVQDVAGKSGS